MKGTPVSALTEQELIDSYVLAASLHGSATEAGDSDTANRQYDVVAAVYDELRRRAAEKALLPLLSHDNPNVRKWAGAHALEFAPTDGELALRTVAAGSGIAAFNAQMTLREWHAGRLRFPRRRPAR